MSPTCKYWTTQWYAWVILPCVLLFCLLPACFSNTNLHSSHLFVIRLSHWIYNFHLSCLIFGEFSLHIEDLHPISFLSYYLFIILLSAYFCFAVQFWMSEISRQLSTHDSFGSRRDQNSLWCHSSRVPYFLATAMGSCFIVCNHLV